MPSDTHNPSGPSIVEVREYGWREVATRFVPLLAPYKWSLFIAALLVAGVGLAVAVVPLFPKYVIDKGIPSGRLGLILGAAGLFLLAMLIRMTFWYLAMRRVYHVQQSIVRELRRLSFHQLQHLSLSFHSQYPSGFLYERVFGNSINVLGSFLTSVFQNLTTYIVGMLFSLGFCLYLSVPLTLVILAGAAGYVFTARGLSKRIYQKTREANEAGMRIVELIMDKLRGVKTIQASAMEDMVQTEFDRQLWPAMRKGMEAILESMKLGFVTEGLSYTITALVIVGGAMIVIQEAGRVSIGVLVAFMGYQGTLIGMMQMLTNMYGQFMSAKTAFDQLFTILDTPCSLAEKPGARLPDPLAGTLALDHLSFAYDTGKPVLHDVSFTVSPGQTVALVGRSGSGKSTLLNLLMRFYDPLSGAVRLDDVDIRDLPLRPYRALFGVVLQDPYLFDTSIAANLRFARETATEAEMTDALKRAQAWPFVEAFPDRLNHRVGEGGNQISGGQRQRLAIARCMLMNRRFVLLDEATSALDPESEMLVQQALTGLFRGRTSFIIAHRLSTIRTADRILVMDEGRLAEDGSYEQLMARKGLFYKLHEIATSTGGYAARIEEAGFA